MTASQIRDGLPSPGSTWGPLRADRIDLSHGSGGRAMKQLIDNVFLPAFKNELLSLEDQARIDLSELLLSGNRLALTTDSFVIDPIFFPGGDIGLLAINGTVNDLAVGGATPLYLTCGFIIEEGFAVEDLRTIVRSMRAAADRAGVKIVTGDTKVVGRGAADKIFVNTAGIGVIPEGVEIASHRARPGDVVVINGAVGNHGAAIITARHEMALTGTVQTDSQPLNGLVSQMLAIDSGIRCMRDATRGGLATVLNEIAESSSVSISINERAIPVDDVVRGVCEILGLDPLYLANEGKLIAVIPRERADQMIAAMTCHDCGKQSAIIGEVEAGAPGTVVMNTVFGGKRLVDMLAGDQLPRIC